MKWSETPNGRRLVAAWVRNFREDAAHLATDAELVEFLSEFADECALSGARAERAALADFVEERKRGD
jgi:hypothetical protein